MQSRWCTCSMHHHNCRPQLLFLRQCIQSHLLSMPSCCRKLMRCALSRATRLLVLKASNLTFLAATPSTPCRYHTALCSKGKDCTRQFCFFAHSKSELRPSTVRQRVPSGTALSVAATDWSLSKGSPTSSSTTQVPSLLQNQAQEPQQAQQVQQQAQRQVQQARQAQQPQLQQLQQAVQLEQPQQGEPMGANDNSGPVPLGWQLASSSGMQSARVGLGTGLAGSSIWGGGGLALGLCELEPARLGVDAGTTGASTSTSPLATHNPANPTALHLTQVL